MVHRRKRSKRLRRRQQHPNKFLLVEEGREQRESEGDADNPNRWLGSEIVDLDDKGNELFYRLSVRRTFDKEGRLIAKEIEPRYHQEPPGLGAIQSLQAPTKRRIEYDWTAGPKPVEREYEEGKLSGQWKLREICRPQAPGGPEDQITVERFDGKERRKDEHRVESKNGARIEYYKGKSPTGSCEQTFDDRGRLVRREFRDAKGNVQRVEELSYQPDRVVTTVRDARGKMKKQLVETRAETAR